MEKDLILCSCYSSEHQIIVHYDEEDKMVYLSIHLIKKSFLKRLLHGIKYVFGYKSRFGAWDEFILDVNDKEKFQKITDCLSNNK